VRDLKGSQSSARIQCSRSDDNFAESDCQSAAHHSEELLLDIAVVMALEDDSDAEFERYAKTPGLLMWTLTVPGLLSDCVRRRLCAALVRSFQVPAGR
jgi:hypothetical protein